MLDTVANVPLGKRSVKSTMQFTIGRKRAKLNVHVGGQTVHIYILEKVRILATGSPYHLKISQMLNGLQFTLLSLYVIQWK